MTNKETYPQLLSMEEVDKTYPTLKIFDTEDSFKEDYNKAVKYAKKIKGEVYTMIDGEDNKTYYEKGLHYVNRFGICVIKK